MMTAGNAMRATGFFSQAIDFQVGIAPRTTAAGAVYEIDRDLSSINHIGL
jgi:hypothetical protein